MGCLDCILSKHTLGDSVQSTHPPDTLPYTPQIKEPPPFESHHNESCRILRPWECDWEKSRNYRYVIYYIDNTLLPDTKKKAQDRVLEHISQLADIHQLNVWVKCLDYTSGADQGTEAEDAKHLYKNMLEATSRLALIKLWDTRPEHMKTSSAPIEVAEQRTPSDWLFKSRRVEIKAAKVEIGSIIDTLRTETELDDLEAKSQIEPAIVAALSSFNQSWKLTDFLQRRQTIFNDLEPVMADGGSKLQAQFFLQCRATFTSLISDSAAKPTVTINMLPDVIAQDVANTIKKHFATVDNPLQKRVDAAENAARQDRSGIQLISFGNNDKGGAHWSHLDDRKKGGMDITDHLHLNTNTLNSNGLGPWFGPKAMLGSVDHDVDRGSKKRAKNQDLYGRESSQVTMAEMERCVCRSNQYKATRQANPGGKGTGS